MRIWRIGLVLMLALVSVSVTSCDTFGRNGGGTSQQLVRVARGDLAVKVSGSGNLEVIHSRRLTFGIAGQVGKLYVSEGDHIAAGDRLAGLVTDSLELAVSQADIAVAQAEVGLMNAEVAVKGAQQVLDAALGRPTYVEVETAQADVDDATSYLQYVLSNMADAPPTQQQAWATALVYARSKLAAAQAKLDALITNYDTDEVALKRLQVDAAVKSRDLAEKSVAYALEALDQARRQLTEATIVAPFDGLIARLNVKEKDTVSPAVIVAEMVDVSSMRLEVQVDEIDVVDVHPGQMALIEVDALPGMAVEGSVDSISLLPTPQSGVVVYDVRISFNATQVEGLRPGMSASADIIVAQRDNVLLIPDRSVRKNSDGEDAVTVMVDGKPEDRTVTLGISDGIETEVIAGLQEGETVVVERSTQSSPGLF